MIFGIPIYYKNTYQGVAFRKIRLAIANDSVEIVDDPLDDKEDVDNDEVYRLL